MTKTNERARARSIAAAFLAALLVPALLAAQESTRPDRPGRARMERTRPLAGLGLTPEQTKALEAFRKSRRDEGQAFRDGMAKLRVEMRELAKDPKANQARIDGLIDKMTGLSAERRKAGFRTRIERDKIFTPQQLETIKTLRSRFAGRARVAGRGAARLGRMGAGRAASFRSNLRRMARLRALRHHRFDRWRRR
jgi:Spy/CpxP family protein refolding chaperone